MYKYPFLFLLFISPVALAQVVTDSVVVTTPVRTVTYKEYKRQQDSIKSIDKPVIALPEKIIPAVVVQDSITVVHPEVDIYDKKLQDELYNNDLFDYMYDEIITMDYSEIVTQQLPTDTLKMRLQRINETTPFNIQYNPILEKLINKKLSYQRVYLERIMKLSDYYFPMFEEELDKYDIPLEMKYLAVVESALDARARSRVGATGLWQFMFTTGRNYDLEVNSYVDERMDPLKATHAACKFLRSLYNIYGDWDLALAAYNSGPGNVNKAIRRSGGMKNYWNIRPYLPRETAGYVPAFQAMMYLFKHSKDHGFQPPQTAYKVIATDTVRVKSTISLEQVAQVTDIDLETLQFYNPSYKLDIIPVVKGRDYSLRLPVEKVGNYVSNEDAVYAYAQAEFEKQEKPLPELLEAQSRVVYRVKNGDYLGKIANKYSVRVSQLKRWNSLRGNNLKIGQRLYIHPRRPVPSRKIKRVSGKKSYTVKSGDSLWQIARDQGTTIAALKKLNPSASTSLKPGMTLRLK